MSSARRSIVIIGGGASGVLLAAHLLREPSDIRVTLIERRPQLGRGVAYSAQQQDHVLNVPASGMSAFADDPDHFWNWLRQRDLVPDGQRFVFVPRKFYGQYLADVVTEAARTGGLTILNATAVDLRSAGSGVEITLENGSSVAGHCAVLAVGHEINPPRARGVAVRVGSEQDTPLDPDAPVMILGSGLSMIDAWLSLAQSQHRGPITVVSRHGLLPKRHLKAPRIELAAADVPFETDLHYFERWFRDTVRETVARGGNWRSVVDALRPFNQRIWQSWSLKSRRRFLQHLRPFWNIHRHRLPPELHDRMVAAIAMGQVTLRAGQVIGLERAADGVRASIRPKGRPTVETVDVARVYDCGGVTVDVEQSSNPLIRSLVARGEARPDTLHIGLDVTVSGQVLDADGAVSDHLLAIGPLTRGTFFEIEAIPDIRVQASEMATLLRPPPGQVLLRHRR